VKYDVNYKSSVNASNNKFRCQIEVSRIDNVKCQVSQKKYIVIFYIYICIFIIYFIYIKCYDILFFKYTRHLTSSIKPLDDIYVYIYYIYTHTHIHIGQQN